MRGRFLRYMVDFSLIAARGRASPLVLTAWLDRWRVYKYNRRSSGAKRLDSLDLSSPAGLPLVDSPVHLLLPPLAVFQPSLAFGDMVLGGPAQADGVYVAPCPRPGPSAR